MNLTWDETSFAKFTYLSDIKISYDGSVITYTITKANLENDKYENTVVIECLEGNLRKFINNASMARPSPDGKKLIVCRQDEKSKKTSIFLYELNTFTFKKLKDYKSVIDIEWNPDSRKVLVMTPKTRGDEHLYLEERIPVWFDSKGFLDGEKGKVEIIDTDSGELLDEITMDYFLIPYFKQALWYGDNVIYVVPHEENPYKLFDIYLYHLGSKAEKVLEKTSLLPVDSNGNEILMLGKPHKEKLSEHNFPYLWKNGLLTPVIEDLTYNSASGKLDGQERVYLTLMKEGKVPLYSINNGKLSEIIEGNNVVTEFDVSSTGKIALLLENDTKLPEAYLWSNQGLRQLTDYNGSILKTLGTFPIHHFRYESLGLKIDGWYIKPKRDKELNKKMPVIVFVHGGPKGM